MTVNQKLAANGSGFGLKPKVEEIFKSLSCSNFREFQDEADSRPQVSGKSQAMNSILHSESRQNRTNGRKKGEKRLRGCL